jgi:predicted Zn-dependent protease with MMP-like domain
MGDEEFQSYVLEGYEQLPQWARDKAQNVALLVEEEPSDEIRRHHNLAHDETLLGHYQGVPITLRGEEYGGLVMPDTITIFREPILDAAEEIVGADASDQAFSASVRKIVHDTVWHEYAHYLGMDEAEVRRREDMRDSHVV